MRYGSVIGLSIDMEEGAIAFSIDGRKTEVMCTQSSAIKEGPDGNGSKMVPIAIFPSGTSGFWSIGW